LAATGIWTFEFFEKPAYVKKEAALLGKLVVHFELASI